MKRITLLFALVFLFCTTIIGQKKYEMVIEKTDGTETVIPTSEIVRTYFREITSNPDNPTKDFDLVGTWCYGSSEEDAFGDMNNIEGYVFHENGTCTYFEVYNQGRDKEKKTGYYTYKDNVLTITFTTAYNWKNDVWVISTSYSEKANVYNVTISGNCMTWTGDDNETLYTREGLTVDVGNNDNNQSSNINLSQLCSKWVCYYQQWTQDGETWNKNYTTDEYIIELSSDYKGKIFTGKDELFEWGAGNDGKTFSWTLSGNMIIATYANGTHTWEITSITDDELAMKWEDKEANYVITCKFKKNSIEEGSSSDTDPEGTVIAECKSNTWLDLFDEAKNTIYCDKNIFDINYAYVDVMDLGEVNGIGEITFPADIWSMWKKTATQAVGHGYLFRYTGASSNIIKYAVVYIVSKSMTSSMSYLIRYITPFEFPDTDIIPTGSYAEENRDNNNYFTFFANGSYISWKHYVNENAEQNSTVESDIKTDIDYIYVAYEDKIILSSASGSAILSYKRNGNGVTIGSRSYIKLQQIVAIVR